MKKGAGIVLVHGYSGSASDLAPLAATLKERFGDTAVSVVELPGHESGVVPPFDETAFTRRISEAAAPYIKEGKKLILIGHSTGGNLLLSLLVGEGIAPALLVLLAVPRRIERSYLERWSAHRSGKNSIAFGDIAAAISFINRIGGRRMKGSFPVLAVHGSEDELVPAEDAHTWQEGTFTGPVRTVVIPGAGHHLFPGAGSGMAADVIVRAVEDAVDREDDPAVLSEITRVENETAAFLDRHPLSAGHIAGSASGLNVVNRAPVLSGRADVEPVFANIEITTRCNLSCSYCARSFRTTPAEDMPVDTFRRVLSLLPHAYRVMLVGLGEPLLHPAIENLIALAARDGRRMGLVTNAMLLDSERSHALLDAGLGSIAFSIDAGDQALASKLRQGTDLDRVVRNIRSFTELARREKPISTAVFTAVSTGNIDALDAVVDLVAGLGVHVMMMTDLNFNENGPRTLWKNEDAGVREKVRSAVSRAFAKKLPVLSVHGLEEFGLASRYEKFLLLPPGSLFQRSKKRTWCSSPWQTIPVNVRGEATVCDCQPDAVVGNILQTPFSDIWNGGMMTVYRRSMLSDDPPTACRLCPRF